LNNAPGAGRNQIRGTGTGGAPFAPATDPAAGAGSVVRPATGVDAIGPTLNPSGVDPTIGLNGTRAGLDPVTGRPNAAIDPTTGQPFNTIDPATGRRVGGPQGVDPLTGRALGGNNAVDPITGRTIVTNSGVDPVTGQPIDSGVATDPITGQPAARRGVIDPATGLPNRLGTDPATGNPIGANPSLDPNTGRALRSDPNLLPGAGSSAANITMRTFGNANSQLVPFNGGIRIGAIDRASFAGLSGLRMGDTIRAVDSGWVRSQNDLASQLSAAAQGGRRAWVLVDRDGQQSWMRLSLNGQPQPMLGVQASDQGGFVRVNAIEPNSLAASVGLRAGDEIVNINGHRLGTNADLVTQLEAAAQADGSVVLHVRRGGVLYEAKTAFPQAKVNASANANSRAGL